MRTIEAKIYLKPAQEEVLSSWMRTCCCIYNHALAQRTKAYRRRNESVTYPKQQKLLTEQRGRRAGLASIPVGFERDALRRVDRGFQAFFRRIKSGEKPGFPRFRSWRRYNSLEYSAPGTYFRGDGLLSIPKLGLVKYRAGKQRISKTQRLLRIIKRASGWYAQVVVDEVRPIGKLRDEGPIGIDVGLESFATMSDGSKIENPRFARKSAKKLRSLQRLVSRRVKGSGQRRKAVKVLSRHHERVASQRKSFCHQHSTELVRNHPLIAVEKLNISGMARGHFAKSIMDAGWTIFLTQLRYKAENAGRRVIEVNARGTSQTCPNCGNVKKKSLSERTHVCGQCGLECHRDHAAAQVILARALDGNRGIKPVEELAAGPPLRVAA